MFFNKYKKENAKLKARIAELEERIRVIVSYNDELGDAVEQYATKFPFDLGDTVYELQLRNEKGRFTKNKPSLEHSSVIEQVVDEKNYFKLLDKFNNYIVFTDEEYADAALLTKCNPDADQE